VISLSLSLSPLSLSAGTMAPISKFAFCFHTMEYFKFLQYLREDSTENSIPGFHVGISKVWSSHFFGLFWFSSTWHFSELLMSLNVHFPDKHKL
jgi:hypothetical protein